MGCRLVIDLDRHRLMRVVVLLLSLALHCERAATRALFVRLRIFRLVSHAERVALTLFDLHDDAADAPGSAPNRAERVDLVLLAARLRAIALLLAHACPLDELDEAASPAGAVPRHLPCPPALPHARRAQPFPDTS